MKIRKIIALDIGSKLIGFAVIETERGSVIKEGALERAQDRAIQPLSELIDTEEVEEVVIGAPLPVSSGEYTEQCSQIIHYASRLSKRISHPFSVVDESYSTAEAKSALGSKNSDIRTRKKVKESGALDSTSAVIIGRRYVHEKERYYLGSLEEVLLRLKEFEQGE